MDQAGAQRLGGAHAVRNHQLVLARLCTVRERAHVAADGERHTRRHLLLELRRVILQQSFVAVAIAVLWVQSEVLHDGEGRHGVDLLLAHRLHRRWQQIVRVVDTGDSSLCRVACARLAGAVHTDPRAGAVRLGDGCCELRLAVLVGNGKHVADEMVGASLVDLGKVGAALALLAHHGDDLVGSVRVVCVREHALLRVVADRVLVSAEDVDRIAAHAHARPGNQAAVDGVAHGHVRALGTLGSHVALGGKSGHHVGFGSSGGHQYALRNGLLDGLQVLRAGMQEEMHVRIDKTGHQRGVAEVDHHRARWMADVLAGLNDLVAGDEHLTGRDDLARSDIEQPRGVQNSGAGSLLRVRAEGECSADGEQKESSHGASRILHRAPGRLCARELLIGRGPVEARHGDSVEPQIDSQLRCVVDQVVHAPQPQCLVPRKVGDDVRPNRKRPRLEKVFVAGGSDGGAAPCGVFVERSNAGFRRGEDQLHTRPCGGHHIHAGILDDVQAEEGHRRAVHGERAKLHGLLMRHPVVFAFRHALQCAPGVGDLGVVVLQQKFSDGHGSS